MPAETHCTLRPRFGSRRLPVLFTLFAMAAVTAVLPTLEAQDASSGRVTGNQIKVVDLSLNASPAEVLQAKAAYAQGHIIRVAGASPADLRRLITPMAFDVRQSGSRADAVQARRAGQITQPDVVPQVAAVRLGEHGDLHQFTSTMDANSKQVQAQWEKSFEEWRLKEVSAAVGDPSPPAQAWTQVLTLTGNSSGDWGSTQTVFQVFRLNGTDISADYYMVLTDPQVTPNFTVPASNCASAFLTDCGWYTSQRTISMSTIPSGILLAHGPSASITTDSGTWSIGIGLPAVVNASFGQSWSQPSVTTTDQSDTTTGAALWTEAFVSESCCKQLPATSTGAFVSHQGSVFKMPPGASFQLIVAVTPTIVYQPAFGLPSHGAGGFYFNGSITPPQFSVNPSTITIAPGSVGHVQVVARIGDNSIGLPWAITNIPPWLNVDQTTGARTTLLTLTVASGTPLGTLGTLNFNTDPEFAAPSVVSGPLKMNVTVGQPDLQGALLIGGSQSTSGGGANPLDTALLYAADSNQFTGIIPMLQPRAFHTSTLLQDGTILVAGGLSSGTNSSSLATAELYDQATGGFSSTSGGTNCPGTPGCMINAGNLRVATRLANGKVLITGGLNQNQSVMAEAEVYDPATRTFTAAGNMTSPRIYHTATLLPTGDVLIAGGFSDFSVGTLVKTAELYNPTTNTFRLTGAPATPTSTGTAVLTGDTVLLNGGADANGISPNAQLYSPATGTLTPIARMNTPRQAHTSTLLQDGRVLVAGGLTSPTQVAATAEIYDPATRTFTLLSGSAQCPGGNGCMITGRAYQTDTLLLDGRVFLSGGTDSSQANALKTTEIFNPSTNTFSAGPAFEGRVSHTSVFLRAPSATSVKSSLNPSPTGQSVVFTANLTVANPKVLSGTVTFYDGTAVLGSSALSNGAASWTAKLQNGQHAITAHFSGNDWYGVSTSDVLVQQVDATATSMTLSSSPNPSQYGATVTLTAQLSASGSAPATGNVKFLDNGTLIGTAPVTQPQLTTSKLSTGTHTITAVYSGDANYAPTTSNAVTQTVNGIATQTALTSSANPVASGATVTFTANVSFSGGPGTMPAGRVVFADAGAPINSADVVNGVAKFTTSSLAQGSHQITAAYSGDDIYAASSSPVLTQTVSAAGGGKVTPVVDLTVNGSKSGATVLVGDTVSFLARIHAVPGYPWPNGSITISDSTNSNNRYGAAIITQDPASNDGLASIVTTGFPAGSYSLIATYGGDNDGKFYNGAPSNTVTLTVNEKFGAAPLQPSLAIRAAAGARQGTMLPVSLTLTNNGNATATGITLSQIALRTLAGTGQATLVSPTLPVSIGSLKAGESSVLTLQFQIPTTIQRLSLTENGTFADDRGTTHQFSQGQVVLP